MTTLTMRLGALIVAGVASGCGLISSDVTNFDLTLPDKAFSVDASGWQVDQQQADLLLATSCAGNPNVCSAAAQQACQEGCSGTCSATTQQCELTLDVSLYNSIDLVTEKPELKAINDEPVIKVTIDTVTYSVTSNTLTVDTPQLTVYVAPMSVMAPTDPSAKAIGTIAPIPAGTTVTAQELAFTATGKAELVGMMNNYKTPFNVLVGTSLTIKQGDAVPTGKLDAVVSIKAHAGL